MDWVGSGTTVPTATLDREQHTVFDLAWGTDTESSFTGTIAQSEAVKPGLGGRSWACRSVSRDVCGSFAISWGMLSSSELDRDRTDAGLWEVGEPLLVAWSAQRGVGLSFASSGAAKVVCAGLSLGKEVSHGAIGVDGQADGRSL